MVWARFSTNMGYRATIRFKVYRILHFEFGFYTYTRLRGTLYDPYRGPVKIYKRII